MWPIPRTAGRGPREERADHRDGRQPPPLRQRVVRCPRPIEDQPSEAHRREGGRDGDDGGNESSPKRSEKGSGTTFDRTRSTSGDFQPRAGVCALIRSRKYPAWGRKTRGSDPNQPTTEAAGPKRSFGIRRRSQKLPGPTSQGGGTGSNPVGTTQVRGDIRG